MPGSNIDTTSHNTYTNMTAAHTRKTPPPENPDATRLRSLVVLSFWAVILLLGLPVWWKTTSIYRASLPSQEIAAWASGTACTPVFPLQIWIYAPSVPCSEAKHFLQLSQHALDDLNEFPTHHIRLRLVQSRVSGQDTSVAANECGHSNAENDILQGKSPSLSLYLEQHGEGVLPRLETDSISSRAKLLYASNQLPSVSSSSSPLVTYLASTLHDLFLEEQADIAHVLASSDLGAWSPQSHALLRSLPPQLAESISQRSTRAVSGASTYHLTFSLFTAGPTPSSWDVSEAIKTHVQPWITALSPTYNFSINTQIQLYASFSPSVRPTFDATSNSTTISLEDLSAFINAAEWPLSPSLGTPSGPTINFVLFVPDPDQIPLTVANTQAKTSWLIPQWGGVHILNPQTHLSPATGAPTLSPHLSSTDLTPAFTTFTTHLLTLLDLPPSTSPQNEHASHHSPSPRHPLPSPLPLRLSQNLHTRTLQHLLQTVSTLNSLSRVTASLPQIPIPRSVSHSVSTSLRLLRATCDSLHNSDFEEAMQSVVVAEQEAEKAFFEKSMVGQVYFPEEHKVAVYLPLLGPVGVPLVVGLVKEIRGVVQTWRQRGRAAAA
ncbi:MAG: hypothetical protein Q9227_000683 [Pyrenula ochraceoflavens]